MAFLHEKYKVITYFWGAISEQIFLWQVLNLHMWKKEMFTLQKTQLFSESLDWIQTYQLE